MTREEAIQWLKLLHASPLIYGEHLEAIDMAIEALQAEPTHGRLIDADALSKKLCATTIFIKDGEVLQRMINDAPTVSVEAVQGEWVQDEEDNSIECDQCHCVLWANDIMDGNANFCPNCGADMRGGDSE